MSIDDFIITYFTKGSGFDTLSTKIYNEVKRGIQPEIYALSAIIFVVVLVLCCLLQPDEAGPAVQDRRTGTPGSRKRRNMSKAGGDRRDRRRLLSVG